MLLGEVTGMLNSNRINEKTLAKYEAPAEWQVGDEILGLYEVKEILEREVRCFTHRVYHRRWNTDLIIQAFNTEAMKDKRKLRAFMRDCESWMSLGAHPNIVSCCYVRELGDIPCVFSEFAGNDTLRDWLEGGKISSWKQVLELGIQCLDGLAYAHRKGIIHGDLKPENCLVKTPGELRITDFGITTGLERHTGRHPRPTPQTDILAFGMMLSEMCRAVSYRNGKSIGPTHINISADNPAPGDVLQDAPEVLAEFIVTCLKKKPADRFQSAMEARAGLIQVYEKVTGGPWPKKTPDEMILKVESLNNRALALLDLGKRQEAEETLRKAMSVKDSAHPPSLINLGWLEWEDRLMDDRAYLAHLRSFEDDDPCSSLLHQGIFQIARGDIDEAGRILERINAITAKVNSGQDPICTKNPGFEEAVRYFSKALKLGMNLTCERAFHGHTAPVSAVCFTPDGRRFVSGGRDEGLRLWDVETGVCLRVFESESYGRIDSLIISPDGRLVLSICKGKFRAQDIETGATAKEFPILNSYLECACISPDGKYVLSFGDARRLRFWRTDTGKCIRELEPGFSFDSMCISRNGKYVLAGTCISYMMGFSVEEKVRILELETGTCVKEMEGHRGRILSVSFSPDGRALLSGGRDQTVRLWKRAGAGGRTFFGHRDAVTTVAFSPDGRYVLSGSEDRTLRLWDRKKGICIRTFDGHRSAITSACFSPDGRYVLSGSLDGTVRLWNAGDLQRGKMHQMRFVPHLFEYSGIDRVQKLLDNHNRFEELKKEALNLRESRDIDGAYERLRKAQSVPGYGRNDAILSLIASLGAIFKRGDLRKAWLRRFLKGHTYDATSLCFSSDGKHILSTSSYMNYISVDLNHEMIRLWSIETGECLRFYGSHGGDVTSACFSPDGRYVLSGGYDKAVRLWDRETGELVRAFEGHSMIVTSVSFSPDGMYVLSGSEDGTARLWSLESGDCLRVCKGHLDYVTSVAFSPDGRQMLSGSRDMTLRLWDRDTGECVKVIRGHRGSVSDLCFSSDGKFLLSGSRDETLRLWDRETGDCLMRYEGHTEPVNAVCFAPDGRHLLTGGEDRTVRLWNTGTGACVKALEGHMRAVTAVSFSPDGRYAISGGANDTFRLWEFDWEWEKPEPGSREGAIVADSSEITIVRRCPERSQCRRIFEGHRRAVSSVNFSPDGRQMISGDMENTIHLWDRDKGSCERVFEGHTGDITSVSFSPDGGSILSGSRDKTIRLWSPVTGECLRIYEGHKDQVASACFSPDGRFILSGSGDETLRLWDRNTGECVIILESGPGRVNSACFSPDGRQALSGGGKVARLWDLESGACTRVFTGHSGQVESVCFSHDARYVLSGGRDRSIHLWDRETGVCVKLFLQDCFIECLCFSPDGRYVLAGSSDKALLWSLAMEKCVAFLEGHKGEISSLCFSPDGRYALTGSRDKTLRLWELTDL